MKLANLVAAALVFIGSNQVHALALEVSYSALHLPTSTYHYSAVNTGLYFNDHINGWGIEFGLIPPYTNSGYTQNIYFLSVIDRAKAASGLLGGDWWGGFGLGAYVDQVKYGTQIVDGTVPSIVVQTGLAWGGSFGFKVDMTSYVGIYNPMHLAVFTVWPLVLLNGGFYVAF